MFNLNLGKSKKSSKIPHISTNPFPEEYARKQKYSHIDHLLSTSPAVIYSRKPDENFSFSFVSDNMQMHYGYNPLAFTKDHHFWERHLHKEDREQVLKDINHVLWNKFNTFEYRFENKQGEYRWVHDRARLICDKSGKPIEIVGSLIDITARKNMERHLYQSNAFLDSIIENIPDMIFLKDAENLRFVRFNKAGENLLGFSRSELLGKNDYDFFPKNEADFFTQKDRAVLEKKKLHDIPEEPIHTRKKGTRYLHTKKIPIYDADGKPEYLLGISEDITIKKKAKEKELEYQTHMLRHEKLASIGLLAAGITHELNNPLTGIISIVRMYQKKLSQMATEQNHLNEVIQATNHMSQVLDDLNNFANTSTSSDVRVNINQIIKSILNLTQHQIEHENIRLTKSLGPKIPYIKANKGDIQQVFLGLLLNAKDSMPKGGELSIKTKYKKNDQMIQITISDTGKGIDEKDLKYIFDPFYTTKNIGDGLGLGLSIIHSIIEKHHGSISVNSKKNEGTQIIVNLPAMIEE